MPIKGDFISFSYNGVHSTELGIVRVSASNRYTDQLLPTIQDKTSQVPGGNGTYFFGSYYTQRQITVNVAFDEVTESQIRLMRQVFQSDKVHNLIFDDEPYKVYYAKVNSAPQLNYIPFGNNTVDGKRIYKGEGTLTFICFDPFAHCLNAYKYLSNYVVNSPSWYKYDNKNEWNFSANLLSAQGTYDSYNSSTHNIKLYNPGDVEADFNFIIPINATISGIKIQNGSTDLENYQLQLKQSNFVAKGNDSYIGFNSKLNLIQGLDSNMRRTGNLYNEYINAGHWFKIPLNQTGKVWNFVPIDYNGTAPQLQYDYLYY